VNRSVPASKGRILLVDLNNEAPYPTLAIGCLVAPLKQAGYEVDVFSPLAHGMKPLARDLQETFTDYAVARIFFSGNRLLHWANEFLYGSYHRLRFRATRKLLERFRAVLSGKRFDGIMVSCYLQYYPIMVALAAEAKRQGLPLLLGGPYYNQPRVAEEWLKIDGVTAIFGGEGDFVVPDLARALISGKGLFEIPGVFRQEISVIGQAAPPVTLGNGLPIPDFDHFRWEDYPHRVIPLMAGRGCAWGHCLFCSDVTTASTRTFRSRHLESVLEEMHTQATRYQAKNFIFFDSKLNSDLAMWYGLIERIQSAVPGAAWVASVHVDAKGENGLDRASLERAYSAGLRRISFGLETGSQRLNKLMLKGTSVERNSQFVMDAAQCGISVRTTIILGYPQETLEDVQATADFLEAHFEAIDRVKLSRFKAIPGTAFETHLERRPEKYPNVLNPEWDYRYARVRYRYPAARNPAYRRAKVNLLKVVHRINRKPLMDSAQQFNGLM
jgi:anaerobic magnesium-protoporphyrin IX monomethyl ester cyclase